MLLCLSLNIISKQNIKQSAHFNLLIDITSFLIPLYICRQPNLKIATIKISQKQIEMKKLVLLLLLFASLSIALSQPRGEKKNTIVDELAIFLLNDFYSNLKFSGSTFFGDVFNFRLLLAKGDRPLLCSLPQMVLQLRNWKL